MVKAGAGVRLVSYIIDYTVFGFLRIIFDMVLGTTFSVAHDPKESLIFLLIALGYFTYFFGNGQTLGMKLVKIKLCRTDGTYPIGYARGFLRGIGMLISVLVIGLGFFWILIDKNKQGWHDKIADTYVVIE